MAAGAYLVTHPELLRRLQPGHFSWPWTPRPTVASPPAPAPAPALPAPALPGSIALPLPYTPVLPTTLSGSFALLATLIASIISFTNGNLMTCFLNGIVNGHCEYWCPADGATFVTPFTPPCPSAIKRLEIGM